MVHDLNDLKLGTGIVRSEDSEKCVLKRPLLTGKLLPGELGSPAVVIS